MDRLYENICFAYLLQIGGDMFADWGDMLVVFPQIGGDAFADVWQIGVMCSQIGATCSQVWGESSADVPPD